jgi:uncharacterized protein with NRDE domain
MCLIGLIYRQHPDYPIILAANRDEFYARPTARASWWADQPALLGGRDLQAGGTWLALHRDGRFGCLTNYRDLRQPQLTQAPSRGELVPAFLQGDASAPAYLAALDPVATDYNGFNLLLWDGTDLCHYANTSRQITPLSPGIHALSNHLLDTPWPKVERLKASLGALMASGQASSVDALFDCLGNRELAPDSALPDTGIGLEMERSLSAMHIGMDHYGTRVASVLRISAQGQVAFDERAFVPEGEARHFEWGTP